MREAIRDYEDIKRIGVKAYEKSVQSAEIIWKVNFVFFLFLFVFDIVLFFFTSIIHLFIYLLTYSFISASSFADKLCRELKEYLKRLASKS